MRIPDVRSRLHELAEEHGLPELSDLAAELHRRPAARKATVRSRPFDGQTALEIRQYAKRHPRASFAQIAAVFDVNPGRVSETLSGKRA